jgi:hypothetical protein
VGVPLSRVTSFFSGGPRGELRERPGGPGVGAGGESVPSLMCGDTRGGVFVARSEVLR